MNISERISAAWRALTGRRDPFAGTYGNGGSGGFAGGGVNRLTASLASWSGSVNADLDSSLVILRARSRALAANNEHGKRFLSLVTNNVVGRQNPKLQVRAMRDQANPNKPTTLDKPANDAIEIHWERWGRTADLSGRHRSLYAFLRTTVKAVARDGEALVRVVRDRRLPYGMGLQLLEADRLDETLNLRLDNGNEVRQGVELDSLLRPIAYYVKTAHPGDRYASLSQQTERVPAADLYHIYLPERAEQVRGYPWMHAVIIRASTIHRFEEAAVVAAQIGASKIAALERAEEAPDVIASMADGQVGGALQMNVQAGEMFELPPGYKLSGWNPEYPHANFDSFLKACLRGLAAGTDVAAHNLTGDMTDVNYSSARIAELAERDAWMMLQDWLITSFMLPLYEDWLSLALLSGKITFDITGKALPSERFEKFRNASRFQGRRWAWVDPLKEAEAQEKLLQNQLTSRTRIAAEQGIELDDIIDELKAEAALIKEAGLMAPSPAAPDPAQAPEVLAAKASAEGVVRSAEIQREIALKAKPPVTNINVAAPAMPEVRVENHLPAPVVDVAPPVVNVAAPVVNVEPATVQVEATIEAARAPDVQVTVEAVMPDETRTTIVAMPDRKTTTRIDRNGAGDIIETVQTETDA